MTGRERIILGVMGVAVIGGGLHFALPSGGKDSPSVGTGPDMTALLTQVQTEVQKTRLTARELRELGLVASPWEKDPFREKPLSSLSPVREESSSESDDRPLYTGYLLIGSRSLAIIDGRDYRERDLLRGGEYRVAGIYPDRVELHGEGTSQAVTLPLVNETDDPNHDEQDR